MRMDQIAYHVPNDGAARMVMNTFGLKEENFTIDYAKGKVWLPHVGWGDMEAKLRFNYDMGIEFELLTYLMIPNCISRCCFREIEDVSLVHFSHIGIHLEEGEDFPSPECMIMVQEMMTESHTNENVPVGQTYHYKIFGYKENVKGPFIKYIKRIPENDG